MENKTDLEREWDTESAEYERWAKEGGEWCCTHHRHYDDCTEECTEAARNWYGA